MGMFDKYNTFQRVDWGIDTKGMKFNKLGNVFNHGVTTVNCNGFFFTTGEYGTQVVAIGDTELYNLPKAKVEVVKEMIKDADTVNAIKNKKLALHIREYTNTQGKVCYDVDFVEREQGASNVQSALF